MVKLTALPSLAIINGFRGVVDFYYNMGIPCARRWPRSPGRRRAPAVEAQWPAFSFAVFAWQLLTPRIQEAYRITAHGTNLSGRDLFIKGYISGYIKHV